MVKHQTRTKVVTFIRVGKKFAHFLLLLPHINNPHNVLFSAKPNSCVEITSASIHHLKLSQEAKYYGISTRLVLASILLISLDLKL